MDPNKMSAQARGQLPLLDDRHFDLRDYQLGHPRVLVRGSVLADEPPDLVLDLLFVNVHRVSLWIGWTGLALRWATAAERAVLADRIGPVRDNYQVYLLVEGSVEHYVIAGRVYWAQFAMDGTELSPLWNRRPDQREHHPEPIGDVVYYDR